MLCLSCIRRDFCIRHYTRCLAIGYRRIHQPIEGEVVVMHIVLHGADFVAPVWHVTLLEILNYNDIVLLSWVDPVLLGVGMFDAPRRAVACASARFCAAMFAVSSDLRLTCVSL